MRYGIEHEPEAANLYACVIGNNVSLCGFIINPSAPLLRTSPERCVYDPSAIPPHGLLEIKCLLRSSYTEAECLQPIGGEYRLKRTHSYYIKVMGQMGLSGWEWVDFFLCCQNGYHLEGIVYSREKWVDVKTKLDTLLFTSILSRLCK